MKALNEDQTKKIHDDGIGDNEIKDQESAIENAAEKDYVAKEPLAACSNVNKPKNIRRHFL